MKTNPDFRKKAELLIINPSELPNNCEFLPINFCLTLILLTMTLGG